ncbi:unnamed protein product (macronuclear) [Paramecium tetraurelia]|uniref:Major facilitator superfamily (MFS) profile domain-containing protein n=1 Tax=Paramecium tetraurelia TaxID=5888 RepID=A0EDV4_PARTE|nr:uncharacterized protein GSPATT00025815001 [Paramecium tetraurelia]CAK93471.1 unnamed protein product [Paramecium tetraurelia]|eukprot:XP_001460868.1 hypothetical protein (macronuclear) [Paramecium tetraurelia strain d4-2]
MIDVNISPFQSNRDSSFIIIVMLILMANASYMMMIPLFPPLIKEKGFTEAGIGIIMCFYPLGCILASWKLGKMHSTKNIIFYGLIGQLVISIILGISYYLNGALFFILSSILRFFQGISNTMIQVPSYSITGHLFSEQVSEKIAKLEMACNFGLICGPLISGVLFILADIYSFNTFQYSLYFVAFLYFFIAICVVMFLDERIFNFNQEQQEVSINYYEVFKIHELNVTFTSYFFLGVTAQALRTYLSVQLLEVYELDDANSQFLFMIYTIVSFFGAYYIAEQKKYTLNQLYTYCLYIGALSLLLYGPTMIGLPKSIYIICFADIIRGIGIGSAPAIMMPLIVQIMEKFKHKDQAAEVGSTLLIAGWSLGDLIGPIIGGIFIDQVGFDKTSVIMSGALFVIGFVYQKTSHIDQEQSGIEMQILIH